jgi:hypothetical protein
MEKTITTTNEDPNVKVVNDYLTFIFNFLTFLPMNFDLIKKFCYGNFTREDYNKEFNGNVTLFFKVLFMHIVSLVLGFWWAFLVSFIVLLLLVSVSPLSILIGIISMIFILLISIIVGVIYLYIKSILYKYIINYFGGNITFNEVNTLIIFSSILSILIMMPINLSYAILIGFIVSTLTLLLSLYVMYFIYKELINKFGMPKSNALNAIIVSFVLELFLSLGVIITIYLLMLFVAFLIPIIITLI